MPDYQKLYHILFNEITDALDELESGDEPSVRKLAKLIRLR